MATHPDHMPNFVLEEIVENVFKDGFYLFSNKTAVGNLCCIHTQKKCMKSLVNKTKALVILENAMYFCLLCSDQLTKIVVTQFIFFRIFIFFFFFFFFLLLFI